MERVETQGRIDYLSQYFDPELTLPKTTRDRLEYDQITRISRALVVIVHAGSIPRRLGKEATDQDLSLDKKRARRVDHALNQALTSWVKKPPKLPLNDEELRIEGVQLIWADWYESYMTALMGQTRLVATWAVLNDEQRWGRSSIVRFTNENNWLSYAMRD